MQNLIAQSLFKSFQKQSIRLSERQSADHLFIDLKGLKIQVDPGVYKTGIDTELMIDVIEAAEDKTFLEIGSGTGAISISVAAKTKSGMAVDVNELAVVNTVKNLACNNITNVDAFKSDVFENVQGKFDIIICNPPYNMKDAKDDVEKMFWDSKNEMKRRFFSEVADYLNDNGSIYFGWANFADIDYDLPLELAKQNQLLLNQTFSRSSKCASHAFIVYKFTL